MYPTVIYRLAPFLIAAAVFVLDRITKILIKTHLSLYDTISVIPGCFNIVHTENPGVAFGLFADSTSPFRAVILIGLSAAVLVLITTVLVRLPKSGEPRNWLLRLALAFILGGAFGNLFDRTVHGTVTDFVEVYADGHYFPAFNLADTCITIGAGLLILDMLRGREKRGQAVKAPQ
jgi:signal peptidase II